MSSSPHIPVMLQEVLSFLAPKDGDIIVDGTFGYGGYSRGILSAADCRVIGLDRDPAAIQGAQSIVEAFEGRLSVVHSSFGDLLAVLEGQSVPQVDGLVLDLGVSSPQLDVASRGFSFREDGPLDMRMSSEGPTAADVIASHDEKELADLIWQYGEERRSRSIARAIVAARREEPITRTLQLAQIIRQAASHYSDTIDPATRTFMALRLYVNQELQQLETILEDAAQCVRPGGRFVVVSFHSLEDRLVKQAFAVKPKGSRYAPEVMMADPIWTPLTKKSIQPSEEEVRRNPRSRSARLRAAMRWGMA